MNKGMIFIGVGFELVSLVLAGIWIGSYLDEWLGSKGLATMAMLLLMMFGWFVHLFVLLKKMETDGKNPPPH